MGRFRSGWIVVILAVVSGVANAHEYKGMSTQIVIDSTSASVVLNMAASDTMLLAPPMDRDRNTRMSRDEFDLGKMSLEQGVPLMLKFTTDGIPVLPQSSQVEVESTEGFTNEPHTLKFSMVYSAPIGMQFGRIRIDPNLFRSFVSSPVDGTNIVGTQRNTVTILDRGKHATLQATGHEVYDSGERATAVASDVSTTATTATIADAGPGATSSPVTIASKADSAQVVEVGGMSFGKLLWDFFIQGIHHILIGWDHIFFVVGIIIVAQTLKSLVKVITAFTIAHSITLILASLNVVKISNSQMVEAIIALSVAYVGLENIIFVNRPLPWRWALVFGFGLIHGLGFAGVLGELLGEGHAAAASRGQLIGCLLTFNVGVEVGQLLIVCLLWPILQLLRKKSPIGAKRAVMAMSVVIMLMGTSFLLDRTFLPGRLPWVELFNG